MAINQGEEFKAQLRPYIFNYDAKRSEPLNLVGADVRLRIYTLPKHVSVEVKFRAHDEPTSFDVPLTEQQGKEFMQLLDEARKNDYLMSIVRANPELTHALITKYAGEHPISLASGSPVE